MGTTDYQTDAAQGVPVQGVPVQGVPQQQVQQHMVTVVQVSDGAGPPEHFTMGCLASGICGCFGLIGQRLCCPTLRGNYGGCTGCVTNTLLGVVSLVIVLAIEQSSDSYASFRTSNLSEDQCNDHDGAWTFSPFSHCYLSDCPSPYKEQGTRTSLYGVEECSLQHILLVMRLIQIGASCVVFFIALSFCLRYRREVKEATQGTMQPLVQQTTYSQGPAPYPQQAYPQQAYPQQQPAGAAPTAC